MRRPHFLKHNIRSESPQACVFYDTETKEFPLGQGKVELKLWFGYAHYTRTLRGGKWSAGDWLLFETSAQLWSWIDAHTRKKTRTYVFAHNLVFDLTVTKAFKVLPELGYKLSKAIVDDPPTILEYRKMGRVITLIDSFNYFKSSLKEIGASIGAPKLPMPSQGDDIELWHTYCQNDVTVLRTAMLKYLEFIKANNLGNFQLTLASQAFTAYRHRFMGEPVFIDSNEKALELARRGYHGGRTECFFIGEKQGDFYLVDVNSMYPFVMSVFEYPSKLMGVYSKVSTAELSDLLKTCCCMADVTLDTQNNAYPLQTKEALLFPVGKFRTVLSSPELEFALARGEVKSIHRVSAYTRKPLFKDYVLILWRLRLSYREAGNQAFEYLCKLLLNTLYGKFGQAGRVYKDAGPAESDEVKSWVEYDADTKQVFNYRQFGGMLQEFTREGESFNSSPAISAHVCAYPRMYLWKLIIDAGKDNTFYCDTDSLVINREGYERLSTAYLGSDLGELKLVKQFSHLVVKGPKDYEFDDVVKIKGIRKNAVQTGSNSFTQDSFSKFRSMVKAGNLNTMTVTKVSKHLKRQYNKGVVTDSGMVKPFITTTGSISPSKERYRLCAEKELYSKLASSSFGPEFRDWLKEEIDYMATELNMRGRPYNGGHVVGRHVIPTQYENLCTAELDQRWVVFTDWLSSHL